MYVVYVNHPTSKAMIHRSDCSRFTRRRADTTMNGYWKWPFSSYQEAEAFAKNTGKKNIGACAFCLP